jgi:probable rRNA maturation factor
MPFLVDVLDETAYGQLHSKRATKLCAAAFSACNLDINRVGEVSVALVALSVVRKLNLKFRNIDSPTDVLSFEIDGLYGEMAGEIVVAPEYVCFERAKVEELVVHGALHLAGMEHGENFAESEMAVVQTAVLRDLGAR